MTALSVLRLIPSPPGKIETGRVFLEEPEAVHRFRREYDALARERLQPRNNADALSSDQIEAALDPEIHRLRDRVALTQNEGERAELQLRLDAATSKYDLLHRPMDEMRTIRGNKISMIFQEPMTALNPVFTVGNQIAETLILHRKADLCRDVLKDLDLQMAALAKKVKAERVTALEARAALVGERNADGLPDADRGILSRLLELKDDDAVCNSCWSPAPKLWDYCPSCGARLTFDLWSPLRGRIMASERKLYNRMLADPKDQLLDFIGATRILRRLVRARLQDEGVRWAVEMLREVKIAEPDRIARQYPFELSGGMRQRSMIAMMMACNPELLIADEPTTALDVTVEAQILKLMKELQAKTNMAILLITHDLGIVAEVCDKVGVMYAGHIAEFGTTEQVFHRMMHPYTNGLMQSIPRFKGESAQERKRDLYIIRGSVPNLLHPPSGCRFHPRCPRALDVCKTTMPALQEMEPGHLVACHNPVPPGGGIP